MIAACESTKLFQEGVVRERHKWEVAIYGRCEFFYLVAMLAAFRGVLINVQIAERETIFAFILKPKSVLEQLGCVEVLELYRASLKVK
jgi:hypothetical protein